MPYAILRFEKRKGGPASAIEKHHERKKEHYGSNPDIDRERTELNYHLIQPRQKYYGEIQSRIEKAQRENPQCKVRKDSVKFIDTIEFRIFRGTLKYNTLIATLQMVNRICDVAICMSDDELRAMSWSEFVSGVTESELIQYLKERRLYLNDPVAVSEEV